MKKQNEKWKFEKDDAASHVSLSFSQIPKTIIVIIITTTSKKILPSFFLSCISFVSYGRSFFFRFLFLAALRMHSFCYHISFDFNKCKYYTRPLCCCAPAAAAPAAVDDEWLNGFIDWFNSIQQQQNQRSKEKNWLCREQKKRKKERKKKRKKYKGEREKMCEWIFE